MSGKWLDRAIYVAQPAIGALLHSPPFMRQASLWTLYYELQPT